MKIRTLAAAAVTVGLLLGAAGPASAETIVRPAGAKTATIKPAGAPAGAKVTKARVTVKAGAKKVATNKKTYRAKPGTYTVASKITFRPRNVHAVPATDVLAQCRVASRAIVSDRTQYDDFGDGTGWYTGQVTVRYTGTCADEGYVGGAWRSFRWATTWTEDDYLLTDILPRGADPAAAKAAELTYRVGDVDYVRGSQMSALPTYGSGYGKKVTRTFTRTVVVR